MSLVASTAAWECASHPTAAYPTHSPATAPLQASETPIAPAAWSLIASQSGSVNYYEVVNDSSMPFIRARYRPNYDTAVLGVAIDEAARVNARWLRWRWRALRFPSGGRECTKGQGDSVASVFVTWKRGLKWYSLKYSWSPVAHKGTTCRSERGLFVDQHTVVLRSGGPLGTWQTEEIDLPNAFRKHFENGDPQANVPSLAGLGILTDGDQTRSRSEADYAGFVLVHD